MNAKVKVGGVITLPFDVVETLKPEPGSEISFGRGPNGTFLLQKVAEGPEPSLEQIKDRIRRASDMARTRVSKHLAGMTTDEIMEFLRGD